MPKISQRAEQMPASPIRKLAPLANDARQRGIKVFPLNIGQPDLPSPPQAMEALHNIRRDLLEYSPSDGLPSLRRKMTEYYERHNIHTSPDEIIITAGGSEALLFAFFGCLNPGDEIIVPEPAYANYIGFAKMADVKVVPLVSSIDNDFALPPAEDFKKCITPRTRAILICNPNNPTGYVYSRHEYEVLRDIVKEYDLYLISDEVYREFCYTETPHTSVFHIDGIDDNVIMIDSVSKRYDECGIRIGAIVSRNRRLLAAIMKYCQARLSPPLLGQIVAEASMDASPEYMKQVYDEYISRRNCLVDGLNRIPGVYSPMPKGAFYTVAALPVENAEDFCKWCLSSFSYNGATIFMAPAAGFYSTPGVGLNQVRVAYVLCKDELREALTVLEKALEEYKRLHS